MQRDIFTSEHEAFRDMVRSFIAAEIAPYHEQWERDGVVSRDVWLAAGRAGLLGIDIDEKYGGGGNPDYRYYLVMNEELARAGAHGPGFSVHNDIIGQYLQRLASPEQCQRWLPGYCSGEIITAIAMSEPGAGSDLQGIRTSAVRDGDHYVLNGQKTFISNGQLADLVIVVARTDPDAGHQGISLLVVERGMAGFERGRNLDKVGMHAQDTSELFFTDVRVPAENLLGDEGGGLHRADAEPAQGAGRDRYHRPGRGGEGVRGHAGVLQAAAGVRAADREVPVQPVRAGRDGHRARRGAGLHRQGRDGAQRRAAVQRGRVDGQVVGHRAVQPGGGPVRAAARRLRLHAGVPGGAGVLDGRVQTIFGGTTEIMKEIIGRGLGV